MRRSFFATAVLAGVAFTAFMAGTRPEAAAHCEVPCGIYDDHARVTRMLEDAATIGKATDQIMALEGQGDAQSVNQMVRWVMTKDQHATSIQDSIGQYFLHQRVKPAPMGSPEWNDYVMRLTEHHAVMVAAMKTKQTVDRGNVAALQSAIQRISKYYPAPAHSH
ncbi:MAG: superoxide dismutase [Ni] [Planctomycetota bacterium]|jgi:nickel superoxide dismutase